MKARGKIALSRLLNTSLAVILAVGLAPGLSFGEIDAVADQGLAGDAQEQVSEQPSEGDAQPAPSESGADGQLDGETAAEAVTSPSDESVYDGVEGAAEGEPSADGAPVAESGASDEAQAGESAKVDAASPLPGDSPAASSKDEPKEKDAPSAASGKKAKGRSGKKSAATANSATLGAMEAGSNDAAIAVELGSSPVSQSADADAVYFNTSLTVTATVTNTTDEFQSGSVQVLRGGNVVKSEGIASSGAAASLTLAAEDTQEGAVTVRVVTADSDGDTAEYMVGGTEGGSTKNSGASVTFDKPIMINKAPTTGVVWAASSHGVVSGSTTLFSKDATSGTDYVTATVTVTDKTLLEAPSGTPTSGTASGGVTLTASGTTADATFGEWSGSDGVYTCTATFACEDGATAQIAASVVDAGNLNASGSGSMNMVIDHQSPTLSVVWSGPDAEKVGGVEYYGSIRTATITISDDRPFPAAQREAIANSIQLTGGTKGDPTWSNENKVCTVAATYTGNSDSCNFEIGAIVDAAGNPMVVAEGTTVVENAHTYNYSDNGFCMLTVPQLTVARNQEKPATKDEVAYYTDPLEVTLRLHALPSQIEKMQVTAAQAETPLGGVSGAGAWTGGGLDYTCGIVFKNAATAYASAITVDSNESGLKFIPPDKGDISEAVSSYTFSPETFVVDGTPPSLDVKWATGEGWKESIVGTGQAETRYYRFDSSGDKTSPAATVRLTITEENPLAKGNIVVNFGDGEDAEFDLSELSPIAGVYTLEHSYSKEGAYTVSVSGNGNDANKDAVAARDLAGNLMTGKDVVDGTGRYVTTVIVDSTAPVLSVKWDNNSVQNNFYYKAKRTATITIEEERFNPSAIKIDGTATSKEDWKTNGDTHTYKVEKTYDEGQNHRLTVEGADEGGNVLVGGDNAPADKNHHDTNISGAYDSGRFVVDLTDPVVTFKMSQAPSNTFGGVDYYRTGTRINVEISVADTNFNPKNDKSNVTVIAPTGTNTASYDVSNWDGKKYTVKFTPNDEYGAAASNTLKATVYDLSGRSVTFAYGDKESAKGKTVDSDKAVVAGSNKFSLDVTAPEIAPGNGSNIPSRAYSGNYNDKLIFYKNPTTLDIVVNDAIGIGSITGEGSDYGFSSTSGKAGDKTWTLEVTLRDDTEFTSDFLLTATDVALNVRKWKINPKTLEVSDVTGSDPTNTPLYGAEKSLYPTSLILDTVAPALAFSSTASAGGFYNTTQTVTTTVTELNFGYIQQNDGTQVVTTMTKQEGNAGLASSTTTVPASSFAGGDSVYSNTITLAEDGHYSFSAHLTDPAGNSGSATFAESPNYVTIDKTAPVIQEIIFDNNNVRNGKYYMAPRTATITIVEHNWDPAKAVITSNGAIGGWSDNGDTHTCIVSFSGDGTYNLSVSCTDKAGNAAASKQVDEFVVDLTEPKISFALAEDRSAYSRSTFQGVAVVYEDEANLDSAALTKTLTGAKYGARDDISSSGAAVSGNSATDTYGAESFPDVKGSDDIYTLTAHMSDMAGNEADGTITFSLNRWGSNFIVLDEADYEDGYLSEAPEVVVREVNVTGSESEKRSVAITQGLSTQNLAQITANARDAKGFYVAAGSDGANWAQYDYHIVKRNFMAEDDAGEAIYENGEPLWADGDYHIVVNSTDSVGNANSSAHFFNPETKENNASAEVSFILDSTPPIVDSFNIEDGGVYGESEMTISFNVTDNIGVKNVIATVADSDGARETDAVLNEESGRYEVTVDARPWNSRSIQVVAADYAGNKNTDDSATSGSASGKIVNFKVTTDFMELNLPFVIGGCVVVAAAVAGGIVFGRRRGMLGR